jgi:hypothetical protein
MKRKISWGILLLAAFLILIISNWKNLKYLPNLIRELKKLFRKNSIYKEDNDFVLIHKAKIKDY